MFVVSKTSLNRGSTVVNSSYFFSFLLLFFVFDCFQKTFVKEKTVRAQDLTAAAFYATFAKAFAVPLEIADHTVKKVNNLNRPPSKRVEAWDENGRAFSYGNKVKQMCVLPPNDPIIERAPTVAPGFHSF